MGKNKARQQGSNLKPKDSTPKKYVFVQNPWCSKGGVGDQAFIDRVASWFYLMMKDRQESSELAQIKQVFWQGTHKHIIVRFHADTDIEPCLGTHMWNRFLKPVLYTDSEERSFIYEYNYAKFENPTKNQWSEGKPSDKVKNLEISENFEVVTPYPRPGPAPFPSMDLKWAKAIKNQPPPLEPLVRPPVVQTPSANPPTSTSPIRPPPAPVPSTNNSISAPSAPLPEEVPLQPLFEPYVPPAAHPAHALYTEYKASEPVKSSQPETLVKKMDPYEEAEVAEALLRSESPMKQDTTGSIKVEANGSTSDQLGMDETEDFLASVIPASSRLPIIKELHVSSSPPAVRVKPEPQDVSLDSAETLAGADPALELQEELARYLMANPPEEHDGSSLQDHEQPGVTFKAEPQDADAGLAGTDPSDELCALLAEHLMEVQQTDQEPTFVKPEPQDRGMSIRRFSLQPEVTVKAEPQDNTQLAGTDPSDELRALLAEHLMEVQQTDQEPALVKPEPQQHRGMSILSQTSTFSSDMRPSNVPRDRSRSATLPTDFSSPEAQHRGPTPRMKQDIGPSHVPRDRSRSATLSTINFGSPEAQQRGTGSGRMKRELSPEVDPKLEGQRAQAPRDPRARARPPPVQPHFSRVGPRTMVTANRSVEASSSSGTQTKRIRTEES